MAKLDLADKYQKAIDEAVTLAVSDTVGLMKLVEGKSITEIENLIKGLLPEITETYGAVVGQLSTAYYEEARRLANLSTDYEPVVADSKLLVKTQDSAKFAVASLVGGSTTDEVASVLSGGVQRIINGVNRETISFNIVTDPDGTLYQRIARPDGCAFCLTIASVAKLVTEEYGKKYHDNCHCRTVPVFAGEKAIRPDYYDAFENEYYKASAELGQARREAGYFDYKRNEAAKRFPNLTMTTKNILPIIRKNTGKP
jgi:hypothetical protein